MKKGLCLLFMALSFVIKAPAELICDDALGVAYQYTPQAERSQTIDCSIYNQNKREVTVQVVFLLMTVDDLVVTRSRQITLPPDSKSEEHFDAAIFDELAFRPQQCRCTFQLLQTNSFY